MSNIFRILAFAKPYRISFSILSVLIVISALLGIASSIVTKFIIDELQKNIVSGNGSIVHVVELFILMFAFSFSSTVIDSLSERLGDYTTGRMGKYLTEVFYRKIFTLSQSYFDGTMSGKIVHQLNRGIISLQDFFRAVANFIFPAVVQSIFIFIVLAYFNWPLAVLSFLIFPVYIGISNYSTKRWAVYQKKRNKIDDIQYGRIQEVLSNMKLVKSYMNQKREWELVSRKQSESLAIFDEQSKTYHILNFFRNFALEIVLTVIGVVLFLQAFHGIITLGVLVMALQLLNQLRRPLFAASFILERIQQAEAGGKEFFEILDLSSTEVWDRHERAKRIESAEIVFHQVSFAYEGGETVLNKVNLTIGGSEKVALVGHSGAGKTTLVNLILRLYEPSKGYLLLNGRKYTSIPHGEIRDQIALVFQESELFSTTVFENVAYGDMDAKEQNVKKVLELANAWDFVSKLKKGMHEEIGERGIKLSGGQKQRIQIARAILKDAPIVILDEATSSLDAESEKLVQDALEKLMRNRLVIIIAHRFSTIQNANKIVVVEKGTISEIGTPGKLAGKKGLYQQLLNYQIEGNKKLLKQYELA